MATEALLVAKPGNAHHHRVGELAVREEGQRRRLAAQLVFGIMQVGEELDFRDRDEAISGHPDRVAKDGLLIQQRVDHPVRAVALLQLLGHAVDAALAAHILPHQDDLGMLQHQVGQREVKDLGERLRAIHRLHVGAECRRPRLGRRAIGGRAVPFRGDEACHHASGIAQPRAGDSLGRDAGHAGVCLFIDRQRLFGGQGPGGVEQSGGMEQRIVGFASLDLVLRQVAQRHIGACVAIEPHGAQMQEGRLLARPHVVRRLAGNAVGIVDVQPVRCEIPDARSMAHAGLDPAFRRLDRNPDPVVLADEEKR